MAHNINTMMYTGATPWHGLGVRVDGEQTSAAAIKAAGLDWTVSKHPVLHPVSGLPTKFYQIMRDDNQEIFAAGLSKDFNLFQNAEGFAIGDQIVAEGGAHWHTAGALGKGERTWALMKMPKDIRIAGTDDLTEAFLLITNGHDGSNALKIMVTFIRVVCQNTLLAALKDARDVYTVFHFGGSMQAKVEDVRNVLKMSADRFDTFATQANLLASKVLQRATFEGILHALIPLTGSEEAEEANPFRKRHHENILNLFDDNDGGKIVGIEGTAWAAYNAITRYVDHHKNPFGNPDKVAPIEKRASGLLFGADATLKRRALDLTLAAVA